MYLNPYIVTELQVVDCGQYPHNVVTSHYPEQIEEEREKRVKREGRVPRAKGKSRLISKLVLRPTVSGTGTGVP